MPALQPCLFSPPSKSQGMQTEALWLCRLAAAEKLDFRDPSKQAAFEALDFRAMESEVEATEKACLRLCPPVVFTHNDLLSGNILVAGEVIPGT